MGNGEALDTSVMSLYEGEKTTVGVDFELSEKFELKVWMHQISVFTLFLLTVVVDVVTEVSREGMISD